jgi:hypothetical protein
MHLHELHICILGGGKGPLAHPKETEIRTDKTIDVCSGTEKLAAQLSS